MRPEPVHREGSSTRPPRGERGQAVVLLVISVVAILGLAALTLDLGFGWYAKRQLQRAADAAALAGAQELPSTANAAARANEYIAKNGVAGIGNVTADPTQIYCDSSIGPICNPVNAVRVSLHANVKTHFASVLGIGSMKVGAHATACQPCGAKPLDIMIVLDRTGSMNDGGSPNKLTNARNAILTFLNFFDPGVTTVGLVLFPPSRPGVSGCTTPVQGTSSNYNTYKFFNYDNTSAVYTVVPLSTNWKVNGSLNAASALISTINCVAPAGNTHYTEAINAAQAELNAHGRAKVTKVIIFLTDGEANTGPLFNAAEQLQPCATAISAANAAKAAGTVVYTIGYSLAGAPNCKRDQRKSQASGGTPWNPNNPTDESPVRSPTSALTAMASPGNYYAKPDTGQLTSIFMAIAADISTGVSRLVR